VKCNVNSGEILAAPRGPGTGSFAGERAKRARFVSRPFRESEIDSCTVAAVYTNGRKCLTKPAGFAKGENGGRAAAFPLPPDTVRGSSLSQENINEHT